MTGSLEDQMIDTYISGSATSNKKVVRPLTMEESYRDRIYNIVFGENYWGREMNECLDKLIKEIWEAGYEESRTYGDRSVYSR